MLAAAGTTELAALETVDCWELLASLGNALADEASEGAGIRFATRLQRVLRNGWPRAGGDRRASLLA